jgi:subfamily B ATP-binding cassette protein MsbA
MKQFFRRLAPYMTGYSWRFVRAGFWALVYGAASAALAYLVKPIMDGIFIAQDRGDLLRIPLLVIGCYLLQGLGRYLQTVDLAFVGEDVVRRVRNRLLERILDFEFAFFGDHRGGELISRVTNDITRVRNAVSTHFAMAVRSSLAILGFIGVAIYRSPELAAWGLIVLPAAAYPLSRLARRVKKLAHRSQEKDSDVTSRLSEIFNNMELIKANHSEAFEMERFEADTLEFRKINVKGIRARELASPVMEFLGSIAFALVIWVGGLQIINDKLTAGDFASFAAALFMIYTPLKQLSGIYNQMHEAVAASERIWDLMDREPVIRSGETPLDGPITEIRFEGVGLNYGEVRALDGVDLTVRRGDVVALVGDSGGGKSSLVSLVPRLYDPTDGRLLINGVASTRVDLASLRRRIGVVTQRVYVFNDTVAANVAYGLEIDEVRVERALRNAGAWDFIQALEGATGAMLGEFGANLSGGQRQRLAIARALYREPDVLILDEATAALDNRSEASVQEALKGVVGECITFLIAHRLSTVDLADRVLLMQGGRITAQGTREELMERSDAFRKLAAGALAE